MSAYALALPESRARRPAVYGTRAQLAAGTGDVEGYLALAGCDKRAGTASYALRIVNQSAQPLRARMTCARLRGEPVLAYPLDVQIAQFSVSETLLPVRVADIGPYERAIVNVTGAGVAFSLEAPAPPKSSRRSRLAAIACAVAFAISCGFGAALATPRVALFAPPDRAFAGTRIDVPYAFGGWATMQYALRTADGRQLSAGLQPQHEGTLHFTLPAGAGSEVVLAVNVAGPFGTRARLAHIAVTPSAPPRPAHVAQAPAKISEFAVTTAQVRAGQPLQVTYATNARDGEVWLIDDAGRLWARAPLALDGTAALTVPQAAAGRQMRAVLHVRNGGTQAVASVAVMVLPGSLQSVKSAAPSKAAGTLSLSTAQAAPGDEVTVTLTGTHGDARISLNDGSGVPVEQGDVPANQSAVTMTAPTVTSPTTFYVTATITQGIGEQTLVKKLLVAPH